MTKKIMRNWKSFCEKWTILKFNKQKKNKIHLGKRDKIDSQMQATTSTTTTITQKQS